MRYRWRQKKFLFILLSFFSLLFSANAIAQQSRDLPTIEYAYPDQSVWTLQTDENGELKNPLLKVAEALFSQAKIAWTSHAYPAGRMFQRLKTGESNFSMLVKASTLHDSCIFSQHPVTYAELRIYRLKHSSPVEKIEDIRGKDLIAIQGYSYGKIGKYFRDPDNQITFFETTRHKAAFEMLRHARAEYLIDYAGPSEEVLSTSPIPEITFDRLSRLDVYLVISKQYPEAANLMAELEQIAQTLDMQQWGLNTP